MNSVDAMVEDLYVQCDKLAENNPSLAVHIKSWIDTLLEVVRLKQLLKDSGDPRTLRFTLDRLDELVTDAQDISSEVRKAAGIE